MEAKKRKNQGIEPKGKRLCALEPKKESLKLADLNEDVLEQIFSYLNAQELVNIVESDEVFLCSSRRAFERKYKTEIIKLPFDNSIPKKWFMKNAKLLRKFGASISKLEITYVENEPIYRRIFHSMVTHCRKTLTELNLQHPTGDLKINTSFTKLNTLIISHGYDLSMPQFHKWFPMLKNLVFDCVDNAGAILNMSGKIASLKCLSIDFSEVDYEGSNLHIHNLNRFLECNPQLNELRLTLDDFNIGTYELWFPRNLHDKVIPEELMTLKLHTPFDDFHYEHSKVLSQLKIPNDRIAHLEVTSTVLSAQICTYIAECVNLKTLKVAVILLNYVPDPFQEPGWIDSTKLELLTRLEIVMDTLSHCKNSFSKVGLNAIRPFLKQSKNLTTIKVRYDVGPSDKKEDESSYVQTFNGIRSQIDRKIWSFTQEVLPNEISFTLKKISA